jgi:hypothetical protein
MATKMAQKKIRLSKPRGKRFDKLYSCWYAVVYKYEGGVPKKLDDEPETLLGHYRLLEPCLGGRFRDYVIADCMGYNGRSRAHGWSTWAVARVCVPLAKDELLAKEFRDELNKKFGESFAVGFHVSEHFEYETGITTARVRAELSATSQYFEPGTVTRADLTTLLRAASRRGVST